MGVPFYRFFDLLDCLNDILNHSKVSYLIEDFIISFQYDPHHELIEEFKFNLI